MQNTTNESRNTAIWNQLTGKVFFTIYLLLYSAGIHEISGSWNDKPRLYIYTFFPWCLGSSYNREENKYDL